MLFLCLETSVALHHSPIVQMWYATNTVAIRHLGLRHRSLTRVNLQDHGHHLLQGVLGQDFHEHCGNLELWFQRIGGVRHLWVSQEYQPNGHTPSGEPRTKYSSL